MDNCTKLYHWGLFINLSSNQTTKVSTTRFLIYFLLCFIISTSIPYFIQRNNALSSILIPHFWLLYFIFNGLTCITHLIVRWRMKISYRASGEALLASTVFRLIFSIILIFVYLSEIEVKPGLFLINFFYIYLSHTVFEIYCLLRNLRNQTLKSLSCK